MSFPNDEHEGAVTAAFLTYGVSSTTINYGLPLVKQQQMLDKYRQRYFKAQTRLIRAKFPAYPRHQRPLPNLETYDLCCEYYREVYTMQTASSAALYSEADECASSDSECDSKSDVSSMPPLEPSTLPPSPGLDPEGYPAAFHAATAAAKASHEPSVDPPALVLDAQPVAATDVPSAPKPVGERGESYDDATVANNNISAVPSKYIPVAEVAEDLEGEFPGVKFTTAERIERVWSLSNEVNRPQFISAGAGRRTYDYDPPHRLKIHTPTGVLFVNCRCSNGKHMCFERRQAYAFPDGHGNIVVKKSKCLLLEV
ncbi:hypothetical protein C8F04DRAFT_1256362 [Mycena alexandri]|uniref:Uncharacterized protein n=1 Tax=Mycena alexandri TaxID=1745969 RepID=A0AAD6T3U3_9AGAR|nr:hypothetical protein C8F04DRAFT_1256362 [Mycena alexandri]